MRFVLLLLLCVCWLLPGWHSSRAAPDPEPRHITIARSFVGLREVGTNGGPWVTRWLRRLGGDSGMAWCGAFAAAMLDSAGDVISPGVRSLVARRYRTKESVRAWDAALGRVAIGRGWLGIMEFGSWQGHVFFVDHQVSRRTLATIEGNTSLGGAGPQRDGGYVAARRRTITSSGPIRWFTPVRTRGVNPHGRDSPRPADVAMAASLRHILEVELRWL